ncbi:MAG: hypothetical protein PHS41_02070 [Victivallaceae bacterium]|nr:hypothetical protein [Victivallaceae bacterium]
MKARNFYQALWIGLFLLAGSVPVAGIAGECGPRRGGVASSDAEGMLPPPPPPPDGRRMTPPRWLKLTAEEEKTFKELSKSNPAAFHKLVRARADRMRREERARRDVEWNKARAIAAMPDGADKGAKIAELRSEMHAEFVRRTQDGRSRLEELKKRLIQLEKIQKEREENTDKAVDAALTRLLEKAAAPNAPKSPARPPKK